MTQKQTVEICSRVFRLVCDEFETTAERIQSPKQTNRGLPRWVIAYLLMNHTEVANHDIAQAINRDYASLYGFRLQVIAHRQKDRLFDHQISRLIDQLKTPAISKS